MFADARARTEGLLHWLRQVAVVADPNHPLGMRAHEELPESTGLSQENVAWALRESLECRATESQVAELVTRTPRCATAHVLLSANVFTATLRAVALAKASADRVFVRASRRAPRFAQLLHDADPTSFVLVDRLQPEPGDHVWVYGADSTIVEVARQWPSGVVLHGHGNGYGVFAVADTAPLVDQHYDAMAVDVAAFDQRGCLSPRIALVQGDESSAKDFAHRLFEALLRIEPRLPLGRLTREERAERRRYCELSRYLGSCFEAETAIVSVGSAGTSWVVPPSGRVVHVQATEGIEEDLRTHAEAITNVGISSAETRPWERFVPRARIEHWGRMQCPPLDGPADKRPDPRGRILT
jgi:hypothetical protein